MTTTGAEPMMSRDDRIIGGVMHQRWNRVRIFDPVTRQDPVAFDPTRPDPVGERCETNPRQRLDSSISYLSVNPNRLVA